jgi:anti-sigma factor RsiW
VIEDKDLHAYVDGQLPPERRRAVELYLANNPDAAARVSDWRAQNRALALAFGPVAEGPVPERLLTAAVSGSPPETQGPARPDRRLAIAAGLSFLAGGVVAIAAAQLAARFGARPGDDVLPDFLGGALQSHKIFTPEKRHPVEIAAADQGHLLEWLSKRLAYPMALPDLQPLGLSLVGGRMLTGPRGPAAFFVFEGTDGERITLYCARLGTMPDEQPRVMRADGFTTVYWLDDGIGFALTGDVPDPTLKTLAGRISAAMESVHQRS